MFLFEATQGSEDIIEFLKNRRNGAKESAQKAKEMGLQYYGFGRYGKEGKVTYRSVHDDLVEVPSEIDHQVTKATAKMNSKKVNEQFEEFLSEATEKKVKLMRDKNGKTRKFMLRRSAAEESHTKNGVVIKYKNGYAIKIKETEDVQENDRMVQETNRTENRRSFADNATGNRISESGSTTSQPRKKITLQEIRKQKEKILHALQKRLVTPRALGQFLPPCEAKCLGNTP
jgi:hypothetical protein